MRGHHADIARQFVDSSIGEWRFLISGRAGPIPDWSTEPRRPPCAAYLSRQRERWPMPVQQAPRKPVAFVGMSEVVTGDAVVLDVQVRVPVRAVSALIIDPP